MLYFNELEITFYIRRVTNNSMKLNRSMDKLSRKIRHRHLIIIIIILTAAIIALISFTHRSKPLPGASNQSAEVTAELPAEEPPLVVIDPGHGGWEPGAGKEPNFEKDVVLDISLEIEKQLVQKNIGYLMTRTDDSYVSLEDRAKIANDKKAKLFISIHNNSFSDSSQSGILTTYNPASPIGEEIAQIMQSKISDIGMKDRDIMPRPNLFVLRHTEMPALLLEIGFISNKKDFNLLTDPTFQQKCAQRIVEGIEEIMAKYIIVSEGNPAGN